MDNKWANELSVDVVDMRGHDKSDNMHHKANTNTSTPTTGPGQVQVVATHGDIRDVL